MATALQPPHYLRKPYAEDGSKIICTYDERLIHAQTYLLMLYIFIYRRPMIAVQWQRNGSFNNGKPWILLLLKRFITQRHTACRSSAQRGLNSLSTSCNSSQAISALWKAATASAGMRPQRPPTTRSSYWRPYEQQDPGKSGEAIRPQRQTTAGVLEAAATWQGQLPAQCGSAGETRLDGPRNLRGRTIAAFSSLCRSAAAEPATAAWR